MSVEDLGTRPTHPMAPPISGPSGLLGTFAEAREEPGDLLEDLGRDVVLEQLEGLGDEGLALLEAQPGVAEHAGQLGEVARPASEDLAREIGDHTEQAA